MLNTIRRIHTGRILQNASNIKLTLFSKQQCGLCDTAKSVMEQVIQTPDFSKCHYEVVDITDPDHKQWWDKYCYDIPVLHVENTSTSDRVGKLFHRFNEKKVENLINELK